MSRDMMSAALGYAAQGWPVFPCWPKGTVSETGGDISKTPLGRLVQNGVLEATTDPARVEAWWTEYPEANIGFALGEAGLLAIDVDPGADFDTIHNLNLDLPETALIARTPRGGHHLFYKIHDDEIVSPSVSKIAPYVDVRSFNSYVLLSPSETDAGVYAWEEQGSPGFRSDEFMRVANSHREKDPERNNWLIEPDLQENINGAIEWLKRDAKIAIEGQGGDHVAYATAAHMRSFGISQELAFELMLEYWNPRNVPPWGEDQLDHLDSKVTNGYEYATSPPGNVTRAYKQAKRQALFKTTFKKTTPAPDTDNGGGDGSAIWELGKFRIRNRAAINHIPEPRWIIEGVIPEDAYVILYAPETNFKTFLALDMALSVATGFPASGTSQFDDETITEPGPVLYMTGEGLGNFKKRIKGWELIHNGSIEASNFHLFEPPPKLVDDIEGIVEFIRMVSDRYKLIVVDTISRVMQGANENAQETASAFTGLVDELRRAGNGTSVLALHHTNKDGTIRGSSVFSADADVVLMAERGDGLDCTLKTIKNKDAPDQTEPLAYELREIDLGDERKTLVPHRGGGSRDTGSPADAAPAPRQTAATAGKRSAANRRLLQDGKRRADHVKNSKMIETAALQVMGDFRGKAWTVNSLSETVAHQLEHVSQATARNHLNELKLDHDSGLRDKYDPTTKRFTQT